MNERFLLNLPATDNIPHNFAKEWRFERTTEGPDLQSQIMHLLLTLKSDGPIYILTAP